MKDSKKFWNRQAKSFNSGSSPEMDALLRRSRKYLKADDVVMDFACGAGISTVGMAEHVSSVVGVDYSEEMIRYAKERGAGKDNVSFLAGTIDDASIEAGSFDVVVAFNVLHLLDDVDTVIERVSSLLKPGGRFIAQTVCLNDRRSLEAGFVRFISRLSMFPTVTKLSSNDLNQKFKAAGFEVVECDVSSGGIAEAYLVMEK